MKSLRSNGSRLKNIVLFAFILFNLSRAEAQNSVSLHVGDPMPEVKYSKWLKGTPITTFKDDQVYIFEFWATWCGPCIAAMPHLSELAKKYEGKANFIGVNVYEKTGNKPYESSLADVEKYVGSSGDRMSYHVIADNNAQDMANNWLKAAGIAGIPSTFVISKGRIVWIGHPIKLDTVIDLVINGTFDVATFKTKYEKESMASTKLVSDLFKANGAIDSAIVQKNFEKAFKLMDQGEIEIPQMKLSFIAKRFQTLLNYYPENKALAYARRLNKDSGTFLYMTAFTIIEKDGLSKQAYEYASGIVKKKASTNSILMSKLALSQFKAKDFNAAIKSQEKAIELVKTELKDPQYEGIVFDYTVKEYEVKLKEYKSAFTTNKGKW